jgi:microcystin-dependent protein
MLVTNKTTADIYFGPLHLPAGIGQTLTVDDTSETSLYLTNDGVADALNNAYVAGQIDVSGEAQPFPRPIGDPQFHHGSGNPEGLVYAPQGSVYLRRDGVQSNGGVLYLKTSGITQSTGWLDLATASGATAVLPPGLVMPYGGVAAPTGWLVCDGSAISRTTYGLLFAAIGTTYGPGDGSTTFNVPDLRGRVPAGYAASGGHPDVSTLGNNDGIAAGFRRPKHRTSISDPGHNHITTPGGNRGSGTWSYIAPGQNYEVDYTWPTSSSTTGITVGSGNANDALDAPAWLVLNYIVKT